MQLILILSGVVLAFHFYYQLLYRPLQKEVRRLRLETEQMTAKMPELEADQAELKRLETIYKERYEDFSKIEERVQKLEVNLPSRKDMASLLEQLTLSLEGTGTEFISLEPVLRKAEEGEAFDSIDIEMIFLSDFSEVTEYLKKIEELQTLLGVRAVEMELDTKEAAKPLVTLSFSTYVSDQFREEDLKEVLEAKPLPLPKPAPEPFRLDAKPYDQRLPGDHRLTMVVWRGKTRTALIDGKVLKEGSQLDRSTLTKIAEDGVWFTEDGIKYYLPLET